jgi:ribosomal protein S18 acetylase RimI-like enzyme
MSNLQLWFSNVVWHTLTGAHAIYSTGTDNVRRYTRGFSALIGFADPERPNFEALTPHCDPGEQFYTEGWSGPVPSNWRMEEEGTVVKMIWSGAAPLRDAAPEAVPLTAEHAAQAVELATLTHPGPFGLRTIELGEYFGFFEGGRLIAMSGERFHVGNYREISGVCTHPGYQGRGLARRLVAKLVQRQVLRGEIPFLHVMSDNDRAHGLYERMGFKDYKASVVRVISPC